MVIKAIEFVDINGIKQCISIRADNPQNPVLLYLHGGPGDAALPLVAKYNKQLESCFVVVVLEQRGAGKSYYPFGAAEKITIDTFVEDIIEYEAPVTFVQGRGDYHVSSDLVRKYFTSLRSHKHFYWFENSCHFPQWEEPQRFYAIMKSVICTK